MRAPDFTLAAGPTMASARTLDALGSQIVYHLDPVFLETFRRTTEKAAAFFRTTHDMLLLQGEGILALEGAGRSLVTPGMHVLNLVQGVYGKGMGSWLTAWGAVLHEIEVGYDDAVDPDAVDAYLTEHPEIELVTVVHSETPSGTISDCSRIGPIAHRHGALTLVDALSSIGGVPFEADEWQLDVCVSGGQKCLGGPVGATMVSVSPAAWERMLANPHAPRYSYVSLIDWKVGWLENGTFPFTPSVTDVVGLEAALDQMLAEGVDASIARHARAAAVTRAGVRAMGLELWPRSEAISGNPITAVRVPEGIVHTELSAHIRERYGVMLSTGQGAGNIIHIGHMGPTATGLYPIIGLTALGSGLRDLGVEVDLGAGIDAAMAEYDRTAD
ncbi:alanine--glyoxylate aminotransferase family protein [Cnuibacter physcomitrellae]|uniref:pyridoxal-phosphate-dependent aminotransferase family protein n=1 Tax=Cnuibacter physcomitrellae TaxID=1619308 RepID=UPI002175BEF3|nr:alanine--glyoxylate aminotransferase family protein [Cnuibacter physcomitrellae]MCS5497063.1 alanine--glyoxylate aminotransferase family protein [Cnuibacter physcomitrellae]